ncbi:MAG: ATP-binding protein [Thermodesulfovibrionales bacterium]|nr:ATP-binding protein [Thermodesulfovibrionales bacterium]
MLIEFSVTNFRSFREKQTLSLATSRYFKDRVEQNCFDTEIKGLPKLLRSIAIYGPNASGKSNLVSALSFMRYMVLSSAKKIQEGEELNVVPFLLDQASKERESEFEIIFIEGGIRFQYGFALDKMRIHSEWLIAYPEGRPQRWFERKYNHETKKDTYEFGSKFLGGRLREDWKNATRSNALFLSVAVQFNSEQLKPLYLWFQKSLRVIPHRVSLSPQYTCDTCETEEGKKKMLDFLNAADLSIADIRIDKKRFSYEDLPKGMPDKLKEGLLKKLEGKDIQDIKFMHKNSETAELVPFAAEYESDGTLNLFSFAGPWLDVIGNDKILFVDEIDSSLHPLVVHQMVRLLHGSGGKAQLVFTTHDTTILGQDILRRDQIWFVEKDESNASKLYPLSDLNVREHEALERGYLRGRYGAIPVIKELLPGAKSG